MLVFFNFGPFKLVKHYLLLPIPEIFEALLNNRFVKNKNRDRHIFFYFHIIE